MARLTDDQVAEIREIFDHYDRNENGVIERNELRALLTALGAEPDSEELAVALDALDTDFSGEIEFDEFVRWWSERP